ncbi:hypothetical protein FOZ62_028533 [Perkinsus olseni]|uniref:Uncharacterized protein n=1 Tax=Perkinsus olseni TaxID=32597 RepID=A0A7J6SRE5_PEROL|nr:hypothetical protein FOZ62_028533 [Perkinsus olseni]
MSSSVRPVKLTLPAVEEGQLDKGSTWSKLGLEIEDDIHLASSSIGRSRKKSQPRLLKSAERFGVAESRGFETISMAVTAFIVSLCADCFCGRVCCFMAEWWRAAVTLN